jgi:hypothetical protein
LNALCRSIRKTQPGQAEGKQIFRWTHIILLLSVKPKQLREKLQRQAIDKGWSFRGLNAEIAKLLGHRRSGGRRHPPLLGVDAFLTQTEVNCESWRRWREELSRVPKPHEEKHVMLADLSRTLRKRICDASDSVLRLHRAVDQELNALQPGRTMRSVFQVEPAKG